MAALITLTGTLTSGSNVDLTASLRYVTSFDLIETAGTPALARVYMRDGNATANVLIPVNLAASGSFGRSYYVPIKFPAGLFLNPQSGSSRYSISGYA